MSKDAIRSKNTPILLVVVAVCFLATGGIFVKLSQVDPIATAAYRILFAIPIAYVWMLLEAKRQEKFNVPSRSKILWLALAGVFLGLDLVLWHISFHYTTVANANLLANLVPFVVVPLAFIFYRERVSKAFWLGLIIAIIGVIFLAIGKIRPSRDSFFGDLLALGTAGFYGLYILCVSRLRKGLSASTVMYYSSFGCLAILVLFSLLFESNILPNSIPAIFPLIGLAVFSHIGGQGLLAYALGKISVSLSSVLVLLQSVIAAIYSYVIFGEKLSATEILGMLITLSGIYVAKRSQG